jgi:2'-5' RNA ligase
MRCFVAVDVPETVRAAIGVTQATWRDAAPRADVGWTDVAKLHVTLKFLGEVPETIVPAIADALAAIAARHAAFDLTASGVGCFPGPSRPRVLWSGFGAGLRELGLLAAEVERACVPLGFPLEARPFRGHATLGRVRSPRGIARVLRAMAAVGAPTFGTWTVLQLVLYRSHLRGTKGSLYEPLARLPLGGVSSS